ncbi:hypothetical protein MMMB2_4661 [Mycobacterium marinum MB2]|nr:hypothetical protein MMMB2_4661 [Mycobacterium marinum MB2]
MMLGWRRRKIQKTMLRLPHNGCERVRCCWPIPTCSSPPSGAASSISSSTTTAGRWVSCSTGPARPPCTTYCRSGPSLRPSPRRCSSAGR